MDVEYRCDDGIAAIRLNRPASLNAVTPGLVEELLGAFARAYDEARVVVLAGEGRAFCAGHDLKMELPPETVAQTRARLERLQDVTRAVRMFPGLVIAAVQGYALGAGCEFALGCDLLVAGEDARFGFPEVGVGLSVTGGISGLLPQLVGPARAKELLVLGRPLTAQDAHALGLVNRVVPAGEHESASFALAAEVADRPPVATGIAKQLVDRVFEPAVGAALATEVDLALLTSVSGEAEAPRERFSQ